MLFKLFLPLIAFVFGCAAGAKTDPMAEELLSKLSQEGNLITVAQAKGEIPTDPTDPAWQTTPESIIPLVSQTSLSPKTPVFQRTDISVRVLYAGKEIGFLISWSDPTRSESEAGVTKFRDAVAIGFAPNLKNADSLPYIGMGNKGRPMAIWHWKASWQEDVNHGYQGVGEAHAGMVPNISPIPHRTADEAGSPMAQMKRTSPVENLLAEGFGTLTSIPGKNLTGNGIWNQGRWHVVVKGVRRAGGKGIDPVTFAIWDGAKENRNGMKGLTRWRFLRFEGEPVPPDLLNSLIIGPLPGADPKRGKQLVTEMGCVSCHNFPNNPTANDVGPDLAHAGSIHRPEYLLESIKDPNAVIVPAPGYFDPETWTSTMPSFGDQIPEKDYNDVVEYLRSLQ
ncbi:MAG: c-type cytochrome [Deltaproteobacteria bacterium]|nr:c-type cytochrome [Deltaproteobacteria bacterium]